MKKNPASESGSTLKNGEDQFPLPDRPENFYKYKSIDEDHPERSRRIFTDNELYFCASKEFNDPFDCKFQVQFSEDKRKNRKFSYKVLKNQNHALNRKGRRVAVSNEVKVLSEPDFADRVRDDMFHKLRKWGICCLSEVKDSVLMWSHYANAHRGFCLEFSNEQSNVQFGVELTTEICIPLRVNYSKEYPIVDVIDGHDTNKTLLTKAKQWEYEKEWRITIPNSLGPHRFPPQCLTGVIFGCRMLEKHKEMIREWCRNREPAITYYEARQSEDSYSLNIVEIL